ncbi:hypothetical protein F5X98DRAFT_105175 [Xylaria grammica]|nr:hypothetical protein F5X98DRAFT_105175 [Xylaria grammica]
MLDAGEYGILEITQPLLPRSEFRERVSDLQPSPRPAIAIREAPEPTSRAEGLNNDKGLVRLLQQPILHPPARPAAPAVRPLAGCLVEDNIDNNTLTSTIASNARPAPFSPHPSPRPPHSVEYSHGFAETPTQCQHTRVRMAQLRTRAMIAELVHLDIAKRTSAHAVRIKSTGTRRQASRSRSPKSSRAMDKKRFRSRAGQDILSQMGG